MYGMNDIQIKYYYTSRNPYIKPVSHENLPIVVGIHCIMKCEPLGRLDGIVVMPEISKKGFDRRLFNPIYGMNNIQIKYYYTSRNPNMKPVSHENLPKVVRIHCIMK